MASVAVPRPGVPHMLGRSSWGAFALRKVDIRPDVTTVAHKAHNPILVGDGPRKLGIPMKPIQENHL